MRPWLHKTLLLLVAALLALATWLAQRQVPHPDMFRAIGDWDLTEPGWWAYPLERNAFKRQVVRGDLNAVFALPQSTKLWAVGQGGLILHSSDDGLTWVQQRPALPAAEPASAPRVGAAWSLFGQAMAQEAPNLRQQPPVQKDPPPANAALPGPGFATQQALPTNKAGRADPPPGQAATPAVRAEGKKKAVTQVVPAKVPGAPASVPPARVNSGASAPSPVPVPVTGPRPDLAATADLNAVTFFNERIGWAVGNGGTILATADGGASWAVQTNGSGASLSGVHFSSDGQRGWAVGNGGTILSISNGGTTWVAQTNRSTAWLKGVHFGSDGLRGWAVGDGGTILATTNGGATWAAKPSGSTTWLSGVHFSSDGQRGWAVGYGGTILTTTNGGANWEAQTSGSTAMLTGVRFSSDGQHGWAVGHRGTILATANGGARWTTQISGIQTPYTGVQFSTDGRRGWTVGLAGTIQTTADGGATWVARSTGSRGLLRDVQFNRDGQRGWAVSDGGTILASSNGGVSWAPQTSGTTAWLTGLHFNSDGQRGWAVGSSRDGTGTIVATVNGGARWSTQTGGTAKGLLGLHFSSDGQRGWAVGSGGAILATTNGGASWASQAGVRGVLLEDVYFSGDGQRGWAVGSPGTILTTSNAGAIWAAQDVRIGDSLSRLQFNDDGRRGWAVGGSGTILATIDGGANWAGQASGSQAWLTDVQFSSDGQRGWAVGDGGTILATTNGGANWSAQASGTRVWLRSLHFTGDGQHGWAVGQDGTVLATSNGGKDWQSLATYQRMWAPWYFAALLVLALALFALLGLVSPMEGPPPPPSSGGAATLLRSDQPVADKLFDRLGVKPAVEALSSFVRNAETEPRVTIAVTGEWGNGKSSVMRMLQTELDRAGFRSAWFNAWHHQQEGRQLSALFNVVHQQAVPQWWRQPLAALRVRSRLIWGRGWFYRVVSLALALVLALLLGDMLADGVGVAGERVRLSLAHHLLQRQHTVLTGASLAKLDPFAPPASAPVAAATASAAAAASSAATRVTAGPRPATSAALTGRAVVPAGVVAGAVAAAPSPAASAVPADPCSEPSSMLAKHKPEHIRPELYCYLQRNLQWIEAGDNSHCGVQNPQATDPGRRCVFDTAQDLLATIEDRGKKGANTLWPSERKAILAAAETLSPAAVFPWLEHSLLGGLAGVLLLLFGKGIAVYGVQLTTPLRSLLAAGLKDNGGGKEASGTVERYRAEFGLLCDALDGRLVIFIDDLDRCTLETVNGMLELTNYLVDVGKCFVVIGAAMDRVKRCVRSPETNAPDDAYATAYLRKLVHIELPVPQNRQLLNSLASAAPAQTPGQSQRLKVKRQAVRLAWVAGALAIGSAFYLGGRCLHQGTQGRPLAVVVMALPTPTAADFAAARALPFAIPLPDEPPSRPTRTTSVGLDPTPPTAWPTPWLAAALALALAGACWRWLMRHREQVCWPWVARSEPPTPTVSCRRWRSGTRWW